METNKIWHDASEEQPNGEGYVLALFKDGTMPSVFKSPYVDENCIWANLDDLLNIQEEPVSDDLDKAAEEYAYKEYPSIGVPNADCYNAFKAGAKWQKERDGIPVSEDLEEELNNWRHQHFHGRRDMDANGEYLERSSQLDLALHFAQWKVKQILDVIKTAEDHAYFAGSKAMREKMMAKVVEWLKGNLIDYVVLKGRSDFEVFKGIDYDQLLNDFEQAMENMDYKVKECTLFECPKIDCNDWPECGLCGYYETKE